MSMFSETRREHNERMRRQHRGECRAARQAEYAARIPACDEDLVRWKAEWDKRFGDRDV